MVQKKALRSIIRSPRYVRKDIIHRDLLDLKSILLEPQSEQLPLCSLRLYVVIAMIFFMKLPTMRCAAVVGCFAPPYFFLMLLNTNLPFSA